MELMGNLRKSDKDLGQVDTPPHIVQSLVSLLPNKYDFFADLGAGLGNLSALLPISNGILVEIDVDRFKQLERTLREGKLLNGSFLVSRRGFWRQQFPEMKIFCCFVILKK